MNTAVRPLEFEPARHKPRTLDASLNRSRIAGLDFLRSVAVLLVIADHSEVGRGWPVALVDGGLGVEIFFVLSGFLITWLLLAEHAGTGRIALGDFYRRRAARLMPALYLYIVLGQVLLMAMHKPAPWEAVVSAALYVGNYYQALTGAQSHYVSHCWSLAVEEQFYLLWPLLLMAWLRLGWSLERALAGSILGLWALKTVLILGFDATDDYVYRALECRTDQLAVGALLAVVLRSAQGRQWFEQLSRQRGLLWLLPMAILASTTLLHGSVPAKYLLGYTIEPLLVALLLPLVVLKASGDGLAARVLNAPLVVLTGQVSYGIYLYHPFVIHPVRKAVAGLTGSFTLGVIASMLVLGVIAWASFRWFEQPLRQWICRRPAVSPSTPSAAH